MTDQVTNLADFAADIDGGPPVDHGNPVPESSWWPRPLDAIVAGIQAGEIVGPVPQLISRTDGVQLLYPGEVHSLAGEPETGKGWFSLAAAAEVIAGGGQVLYVDCEDSPASIVGRLLALGVSPTRIVERFAYIRPQDPLPAATLEALIASRRWELAVIDGLSEAYNLLGLDPYSNVDAARFLAQLPRPIASAGAAVLLIDHVVKAREGRGRYALGAQHKLAGIAVAYTTDAITTPSRTETGVIKVKLEKDRHGHVRAHTQAGQLALMRIAPSDGGNQVTVTIEPPDVSITAQGELRPTELMERASRLIEETPGLSRTEILDQIHGRREYATKALTLLVSEGYVHALQDGRTKRHHSANRFRKEGADDV